MAFWQSLSRMKLINQNQSSVIVDSVNHSFGGLLNKCGGFEIINGVNEFNNVGVLYYSVMLGGGREVCDELNDVKNLNCPKKVVKKYENQRRKDLISFKKDVMRWCLKGKLICNFLKFGELLLKSGKKEIVVVDNMDGYFGVKKVGEGVYCGENVLGELLMELREEIVKGIGKSGLKVWEVDGDLKLKVKNEWVENVYLEGKTFDLGMRSFEFLIGKHGLNSPDSASAGGSAPVASFPQPLALAA